MTIPYCDPNLGPDSLVSVVGKDGVVYTDSLKNMQAIRRPRLSRWQRFTRRLTPARFRKPLRPASPVQRTVANLAELQRRLDGMFK